MNRVRRKRVYTPKLALHSKGIAFSLLLVAAGCIVEPTPDVGEFSHSHADVKRKRIFAFTQREEGQDPLDVDSVTIDVTFTAPDGQTKWTAPKDTYTDWASVPDRLLSLVGRPDSEKVGRPALIHDAYCQEFRTADGTILRSRKYRSRTWVKTHLMFYDACLASGASEYEARSWWVAVHVGGPKWDASGNTIENRLQTIAREVVYALLYGPDGQRKNSFSSMKDMESKLANLNQVAKVVMNARNQAIAFVQEDKIEACGAVVDKAIEDLDKRAAQDKESSVVYEALGAELSVDVAQELREKNPEVALVQYGRATQAFQSIREHEKLEASATERIAKVNLAEALAHKKLGKPQLAIEKLDEANQEVNRLKTIDPESAVPSSLGSQIESARQALP